MAALNASGTSRTHRQYVKLCDVADFGDPELCDAVGEIEGRPAPGALTERKQWERGMLALALAERGCLDEDATILAIGAGEQRPVIRDNQVKVATVMTVTMSLDHRAIDGAVGAEFLQVFKKLIDRALSRSMRPRT